MTVQSPPIFEESGAYAAADVRQLVQAILAGEGTVTSTALAVTANGTPNITVNVAAGRAFILGTEDPEQGVYYFTNDATVNLPIAASDPTNPRNDLVVAQIRDAVYSGSDSDARLTVIAGTPAASPADPAIPANTLVLARVRVDAAVSTITSGKITDLRTRVASLPGPSADALTSASQSTASSSYGNLSTVGPTPPALTTGTRVKVTVSAAMSCDTGSAAAYMGVAVSGASAIAADDAHALEMQAYTPGATYRMSRTFTMTVTPGANIFAGKYKVVGGGNATFADREIIVERLN